MNCRLKMACLGVIYLMVGTSATGQAAGQAATPAAAARQIDRLLAEELPGDAAPAASDDIWQRRVYLDLLGRGPSPEEITAFALDPAPHKRTALVQRLIADPQFAQNWSRYWRDVVLYRRTEDRAFIAASALEEFFRKALHNNTPWDQVARELITATGDVQTNGATGLIMAQAGQPEEVASEVSRIFLGIQIQCAQCHDHKTDRWKREEFHELAAFFPRIAVRQDRSGDQPTFLVTVNDRNFNFRRNPNARVVGTPEHRMPDLDNPTAEGTLMKPEFFLTGQAIPLGTRDADRRGQLADWVTAKDNPWFAKACVNRVWAELLGEGLSEPVDDLGPDRQASAPKTFDYLAAEFAASAYDMKWLYQTILFTDVYQRESRGRRTPDQTQFQANCSQRLRGDQLFDALLHALDLPEPGAAGAGRGPANYRRIGSPRNLFNFAFGYDPSEPRDEVGGSIPQTLLLMNSPTFNQAINARRSGGLGKLLAEIPDDRAAIEELYLKALSRQPSDRELATCLQYVQQVGNRGEAFEDLLWSLINSTEFLHRR